MHAVGAISDPLDFNNRLESQISDLELQLEKINCCDVETGNSLDDALAAVELDNQRAFLKSRINRLQGMLNDIRGQQRVVSKGVNVGDIVVLEANGTESKLRLVDHIEFYRPDQCISAKSPLGKSLLGKTKGAEVLVETPAGGNTYKLVDFIRA